MHPRRSLFPLVILGLALLFSGCSKKAGDATAQNSANQANAQSAANQSAGDNSAANQAPPANGGNGAAATGQAPPASTANSAVANQAPAPIIIPARTPITVRLQQSLSSASAVPGERFEAVLEEPIVMDNQVVVPSGAYVSGHVVSARRSGRLRHPGELALTLDDITVGNQQVRVLTSSIAVRGGSHKKRNLGWIGGGTGGGALIDALAGAAKGALIGGGIGAAAGTTTAFLTGKKDVGFAAEVVFQKHPKTLYANLCN
jgi:hypothetical protein